MASSIDMASVDTLANSIRDVIQDNGPWMLREPKRFYALLADYYGHVSSPEMTILSEALSKNDDVVLTSGFASLPSGVTKEEILAIADRGARRLVSNKLASTDDARACMAAIAMGVGRASGVVMGSAERTLRPKPEKKPPTDTATASILSEQNGAGVGGKTPTSGTSVKAKPPKSTPSEKATRLTPPPGDPSHTATPAPAPQQTKSHPILTGIIAFLVALIATGLLASALYGCSSGSPHPSSSYTYHSSSSVVQPRSNSSSAVQPRPALSTPEGVHELLPRSNVDHYAHSGIHEFSDLGLFMARNEF